MSYFRITLINKSIKMYQNKIWFSKKDSSFNNKITSTLPIKIFQNKIILNKEMAKVKITKLD